MPLPEPNDLDKAGLLRFDELEESLKQLNKDLKGTLLTRFIWTKLVFYVSTNSLTVFDCFSKSTTSKQTNIQKHSECSITLKFFFPFDFGKFFMARLRFYEILTILLVFLKVLGLFFPPEVYFRSIGFALKIALCWIIHIYQTLLWSQISISDRCVSVFMVHALTITI